MTQLNEEHFEVIDRNKAKRYPEQKIKKARDTLRKILKVYHYESEESNMSKDVVTELESLVGYLK